MKTWIKDKWQSDYMQRQIYMMSNLGLFYIILIALFAVPLMGTFVVVLIKGVLDFQYLILAFGIICVSLIIFYISKFFIRVFHKIKKDGIIAINEAQVANNGKPVQIGILNGLITLSYGGNAQQKMLPFNEEKTPYLLQDMQKEVSINPVNQLKELSELKKQGIIDDNEFIIIKQKILQDMDKN